MKRTKLIVDDCKDVLDTNITIGTAYAKDNKRKSFMFNAWANEYYIYHSKKIVSGGQAIEELLDIYNEL
jgi:hypothetical protein